MKTKFFCLVLLSLLFCACSEKNQPTDHGSTISCNPTTKIINAVVEEFVVTIKSTTAWSATVDQTWVTLSPNNGQGDAFVTVKVNGVSGATANVLFSNGHSTATLVITCEMGGDLSGEFSVSSTSKVHFSQGNLQYVGTWQFAENQWDYFGSNQSDNHRDLFGWGTGNAPNKVSRDYSDYSIFTDWGTNAIINGGNTVNQWRTLTKDEWYYLFRSRTHASSLFGLGSVNGVNGTILLPDNWTLPAGASFTASTEKGLAWRSSDDYYYNSNGNHFSDNTYSTVQWAIMESAGAVFLPAAGSRDLNQVSEAGSMGNYWSVESSGTGNAYYLYFSTRMLVPQSSGSSKYYGKAVRLVKDVEN